MPRSEARRKYVCARNNIRLRASGSNARRARIRNNFRPLVFRRRKLGSWTSAIPFDCAFPVSSAGKRRRRRAEISIIRGSVTRSLLPGYGPGFFKRLRIFLFSRQFEIDARKWSLSDKISRCRLTFGFVELRISTRNLVLVPTLTARSVNLRRKIGGSPSS